jgi:hypothetical protein
MKNILVLLMISCVGLVAQDLPEKYAPFGQLIVTPFVSAPFPHPLRAEGHYYKTNFFSAAEHYSDSRVVLFVPKGFHAGRATDFVVHFHGWGNALTNVLPHYQLIEQFAASRRNAILIVPQGPVNASDSFGGKLEDEGGLKRFIEEAVATLKQHDIIKSDRIGQIILSGHSGGYGAVSSAVAWGGLSDHVREVWLFDSLYANTERFVVWFGHHKGRFIDLYTEQGGTKEETEHLMTALKGNQVPFISGDETNVSTPDLRGNHLVFLFSALPHDEVMHAHQTFRRFLETSTLGEIKH